MITRVITHVKSNGQLVKRIPQQDDVKRRLAAGGVGASGSTPEQLRALMQHEIEQVEGWFEKVL